MKKSYETRGACCENLALSVSPAELELAYRCWIKPVEDSGGNRRTILSMDKEDRAYYRMFDEIYLIYPMLEFLYADHIHPNGNEYREYEIFFHYRCRHHDKTTGKCGIYSIRPKMCISFPDGHPCKYEGCSCPKDLRDYPEPQIARLDECPSEGTLEAKCKEFAAELSEIEEKSYKKLMKPSDS